MPQKLVIGNVPNFDLVSRKRETRPSVNKNVLTKKIDISSFPGARGLQPSPSDLVKTRRGFFPPSVSNGGPQLQSRGRGNAETTQGERTPNFSGTWSIIPVSQWLVKGVTMTSHL